MATTFNKITSTHHSDRANEAYFGKEAEGNKRVDPRYNLKVPDSEKTKDWYINYVEYIVPARGTVIDDFDDMLKNYEIYNGDLRSIKKTFQEFCNPVKGVLNNDVDDDLQPYPVLHNKVNVLKGELIKRNDDYKVILLTNKAIKEKNEALKSVLQASIQERIALAIKRNEAMLQGMNPNEAQQMVQDLQQSETPEDILFKDFLSDSEILGNAILKYARFDQDIKRKRMETFEDVAVVDRCFIYVGFKHGKPHIEVRNPLRVGFQKNPDDLRTHKGDYTFYRRPITLGDVQTHYWDLLEEQDKLKLGLYTYDSNQKTDVRHDVKSGLAIPVFDHTTEELFRDSEASLDAERAYYDDKNIGTYMGQGLNYRYNNQNMIWETHIEFKAYTEIDFLTYTDDYNKKVTEEMKGFEIPDDAKKVRFTNRWGEDSVKWVWYDELLDTEFELERLWIPRKYEVVRLGHDIYPIYREVPYQTTNIDNPYDGFELSTKGAIFTARNAKSVSLLQRAIPLYMQYLYLKHVQNRELSKYQGFVLDIDVDQIPDDLARDAEGNPIAGLDAVAAWLKLRAKTNINFYSGSQTNLDGTPNWTRTPGSKGQSIGSAQDLYNLQLMIDLVFREIGMAMGVSPEREAMISRNSNVTDNQQSIVQSHHITEPFFYLHSEIWRDVMNDYIKCFKAYCRRIFEMNPELKEHSLFYILPNGTKELLSITPKMLEDDDIALATTNSGADVEYREFMKQLAHAFGQNAGEGMETVSALIKALSNGSSSEETHRMIQIEVDKQKKRVQEMEKMKAEQAERLAMMQKEAAAEEHERAKELIAVEGEQNRLTKMTPSGDNETEGGEDEINQKDVHDMNMDTTKAMQDEKKIQETIRHNKEMEKLDKEKIKVQRMQKQQKPST